MQALGGSCQIGLSGNPIAFPYQVGQLCRNGMSLSLLPQPMRIEQLEYATAVARFGSFRRAAEALRPGGVLWLVANRHLPYEAVLKSLFKRVTPKVEANGYKIYETLR